MKIKLAFFFSLLCSFFSAQIAEQKFEYYQDYDTVALQYKNIAKINVTATFDIEQNRIVFQDPNSNKVVFKIISVNPENNSVLYNVVNSHGIRCTIKMYTEGNKHAMEIKYTEKLRFKALTKY